MRDEFFWLWVVVIISLLAIVGVGSFQAGINHALPPCDAELQGHVRGNKTCTVSYDWK